MALGDEKFSGPVLAAVLLISAGTGVATAVEAVLPAFSWIGFSAFLLSIVFEAVRVVCVQRLLGGKLSYNVIEVVIFLGPAAGAALLAAAAVWEREGLISNGFEIMARQPGLFVGAFSLGFLVNLSTFFAIRKTSGLTFKIAGCVKNAAVVWLGVLLGDRVSGKQLFGYAVSLLGFGIYTYAKSEANRRAVLLASGGGKKGF